MKLGRHAKKVLRYSRDAWLGRALHVLSREGRAKLRIAGLCRDLGVTKGSFYHHFKSRDDFIKQLLDYWDLVFTAPVIEEVYRVGGGPEKRLLTLMETLFRRDYPKYDLAIKAWAAQDSKIARRVRSVDRARHNFIKAIFTDMGFNDEEAEMRTRTFIVFHSMESSLCLRTSRAERHRLLRRRHRMLTKK